MKIRILYIEDSKVDTLFLRKQVDEYSEDFNIELIIKETAEKGLKLLEKDCNFDVILVDLVLPLMHGDEFIKLIKNYDGVSDIPIIIISGSEKDLSNDIYEMIELQIEKPVQLLDIIQIIVTSLRNKLQWMLEQ